MSTKIFHYQDWLCDPGKISILILGASNGGVVKVFDKKSGALVLDDCGVLGVNEKNEKLTTQSTQLNNHDANWR